MDGMVMKKKEHVQYQLRISKRRKTVSIKVTPSGTVVVSAPPWINTREIEQIVAARTPWIRKHQQQFAKIYRPPIYRTYQEGSCFPVLGQEVPLVIDDLLKGPPVYDQQHNMIRMRPIPAEKRPAALRECYRSVGKRYVGEVLPRLLYIVGRYVSPQLSPKEVTLRSMSRRWGSCSHDGRITLSLRLFGAPTQLVDYVMIHELVHLYHPHHQRSFYKLLEEILPDWRERSNQLRQISGSLMIEPPLDL